MELALACAKARYLLLQTCEAEAAGFKQDVQIARLLLMYLVLMVAQGGVGVVIECSPGKHGEHNGDEEEKRAAQAEKVRRGFHVQPPRGAAGCGALSLALFLCWNNVMCRNHRLPTC